MRRPRLRTGMEIRTQGGVMRRNSLALYVLVSLCVCAAIASAQEITGSIVGTVSDKSGAVVAGATVTVENADKNDVVVRVLSTNDKGEFVAPFLPIGHYTLIAQAQGFRKIERRGLTLNVNDVLTTVFSLEPGAVPETVKVEAEASPGGVTKATA